MVTVQPRSGSCSSQALEHHWSWGPLLGRQLTACAQANLHTHRVSVYLAHVCTVVVASVLLLCFILVQKAPHPMSTSTHYSHLSTSPPAVVDTTCRGRRAAGLGYVLIYSASCLTKHSPRFAVLMFGRVLGGIATSLLYSAFESWLVAEHFKRGFSGAQPFA